MLVKLMLQIQWVVLVVEVVVLVYVFCDDVQECVVDLFFGKVMVDGRLLVSIGGLFFIGLGVMIILYIFFYFVFEEYGMKLEVFCCIDMIVLEGIKEGVYFGCQVLVMKDGKVLYDWCFGYYIDINSEKVKLMDIYDLVFLFKIIGMLLVIMKFYDKGCFNLIDKVLDYLFFLCKMNKENLIICELFMYQFGLFFGLFFYQEVIDGKSYKGLLFKQLKDVLYMVWLGVCIWGNLRFWFNKGMVFKEKNGDYIFQVCDSLWLNWLFCEEIWKKIVEVLLKDKSYCYSDVGFILLQMFVEEFSGKLMDEYLW